MPLHSFGGELTRAQREQYAIPLFDVADHQSTEGLFQALEERRAPTIVALYAGLLDQPNAAAFAAYLKVRCQQTPIPTSLMLDHGGSFEQCIKALSLGFTDVMYDGSKLPIEENIATTKLVVRAAHAVGACVEAELGHVGSGGDYQQFGALGKGFTNPDAVERFVEETGVDFLAVAIGTAHGLYSGEPKVDLDLLRRIRSRVGVPLVLHGGSGVTEEQFRGAIAGGVAKINVATDLYVTTGQRLTSLARERDASYWEVSKASVASFRERCAYYLDLFDTSGKA